MSLAPKRAWIPAGALYWPLRLPAAGHACDCDRRPKRKATKKTPRGPGMCLDPSSDGARVSHLPATTSQQFGHLKICLRKVHADVLQMMHDASA